ELSDLGPVGVLSIRWSVWLPRPAPGCDGATLRRASPRSPADSHGRRASVPGRRRPALVASPNRCGRPNAHLRRPALAPLRNRAVRAGDWRRRDPRGGRTIPGGPRSGGERGGILLRADAVARSWLDPRALPSGDCPRAPDRTTRFALDWNRRLE